jgi:phytol kinase
LSAFVLPPFGTMAGEVARGALVSLAIVALFGLGEAWKRWGDPRPEWTRKLVHFGAGAIVAAFPWLIASHWTVLALALAFAGIILGTRRLGLLGSVHGVSRRSEGGVYYPLAIYLLFLVAAGEPVFYLVSLLVLMVADSLAALLGSEYGRRIYAVEGDRRSLEGSAVFLLTTFLAVHLPLLLATELGRGATVLIAAQVALTVTILEGISTEGSDNLVVPLATYFLLANLAVRPPEYVGRLLAAQLLILLLVGLLAWRLPFLAMSSAMGLGLAVYGIYALGGADWTLAPALAVLAFVGFFRLARRFEPDAEGGYHVRTLFYIVLVPLLLVALNNAAERGILPVPGGEDPDPFYVPFVGVVAAHLAIVCFAHLLRVPSERRRASNAAAGAFSVLAFVVVVPVGLMVGAEGISFWRLAAAASIALVALLLYLTVRRLRAWPKVAPWDLRLQTLSVLAAASLVVPIHLWRIGVG